MLDTWLEVFSQKEKQAQDKKHVVDLMTLLPKDTLLKIAKGEEKLGSNDGEWLEKYHGTPFLSRAVELARQELEIEKAEIAQRAEDKANREAKPDFWEARDSLRVEKKLLDLELAQAELGGEEAGMEEEMPQGAPEEIVDAPSTQEPPPVTTPPGMGASPVNTGQPDLKMAAARMKVAFSITEKGHKYDAAIARQEAENHAKRMRIQERQGVQALGGSRRAQSGLSVPEQILTDLRFANEDPLELRHQEYVAKKHEQGRNAYNPFGGMLTPSKYEHGGTPGLSGVFGYMLPEEEAYSKDREKKTSLPKGNTGQPDLKTAAAKMKLARKALEREPKLLGGDPDDLVSYYGEDEGTDVLKRMGLGVAAGTGVGVGVGHLLRKRAPVASAIAPVAGTVLGLVPAGLKSREYDRAAKRRYAEAMAARKTASPEGERLKTAAYKMILKSAQAKMDAGFEDDLTELEKEAFWGAVGKGVLGIGKGLKGTVGRVIKGSKGQLGGAGKGLTGAKGAMEGLKSGLSSSARLAGRFIKKNPNAAAGIGAGALGGAALLGGAAGY